ncbi:Uncharacterised protein [Rodentibacter pneumotropicus]|uniref:DUF2635 domain-containing protein n=1 Tax=Rodentibacter pneumotropicus TaxID=758 RepID=A0A448MJT2_9PAST|nr:Uncharacterised protein [Rodentibacter pneumotropicus]
MKVKAKDGIKVPMENQPYVYIEQAEVEIAPTVYYQRRIHDGDLIVVTESRPRKQEKNDE